MIEEKTVTYEEYLEVANALEDVFSFANISGWCSYCRNVFNNISEHKDDCPVKKAHATWLKSQKRILFDESDNT